MRQAFRTVVGKQQHHTKWEMLNRLYVLELRGVGVLRKGTGRAKASE